MLEEPGVGYIRIVQFSENTGKEFKDALSSLRESGAKGLIIDLRANPGGLLTSCVEIAKEIVPAGLIVSVVQRDGTREEYYSEQKSGILPMVVLIDGNSASASEILAGALHDAGAAELVGKTSYEHPGQRHPPRRRGGAAGGRDGRHAAFGGDWAYAADAPGKIARKIKKYS